MDVDYCEVLVMQKILFRLTFYESNEVHCTKKPVLARRSEILS